MTARTPRTLCHLLTIMFPRQRGGLQLSQATQTAASSAAMSGLPVDSCWHFCKVAGCQQTKCVNLAFGCSIGLRFTAVPTTGLWYCWRAWSGSVTGPPHVYMRCTLWVALKAFWWSELVPSQTPPRKKKKTRSHPTFCGRKRCLRKATMRFFISVLKLPPLEALRGLTNTAISHVQTAAEQRWPWFCPGVNS